MEILNQIWNYALPIGGFTVGAIIIAIGSVLLKGSVTKAFEKKASELDLAKIEQAAVDKGIEKVKEISFKQSIQPLVNSELEKVYENVARHFEELSNELAKKQEQTIDILEKLSAYFDNSVGVPDTVKAELKKAIAIAKDKPITEVETTVEEVAEEPAKTVVETDTGVKKAKQDGVER